MAPQPTSTTVLIIALVLNTLPAPEQPRLTENRVGMCGAGDDLGSSGRHASFRHLPSFPPAGSFISGSAGVVKGANATTGSSALLMLVVSLPGEGNQSAPCHPTSYTDTNHTIPWSSLMLEPAEIFGGAPPRVGELVSSYPFGLNKSFDTALSSHYAISVMLIPSIQEPHTYGGHPAIARLVHFCCAFIEENRNHSSWREAFSPPSRSNRGRYRNNSKRLPRESVVRHRKLLGSDDTSTKRNLLSRRRRQVLVQERRVVRTRRAATARVAVGLALFGLLCALVAVFVFWRMRKKLEDEKKKLSHQQIELCPSGPRRYGRNELAAATGGFAEEGKIGRGGFGPVYRAFLDDQERHVAVKVMSQEGSQQGRREFQAEVKVMTRLRHRNIVHLLGWCDAPGGLMLVYEFLPNGSLDKHLYDPDRLLSWSDRYRIALGVGSAILYLHTECEQCVLHGDIKPANILLDHSRNAKLGDFGLARLIDHGTDSSNTITQVVAGTPGYMDPELVNTQRPCPESDVFSFGVVLLEIACGRRPTTTTTAQPNGSTPLSLLNWVRGLYRANSVLAAADRRLDGDFDDEQMRRVLVVGLWCAHHDQSQRPSIVQAMDLLRRQDSELLPLQVDIGMQGPDAVRSLEEIAYGDFSEAEDSASGNTSTDTAYHTSTDSSCLPE